MGGYGSGRRYDARIRVEDCLTFPTSWLLQNSYFALSVGQTKYISLTWSDDRNNSVYLLTGEIERFAPYQMRLYLGSTGQVVYLHPTDCRFGGLRWWFNCPGCARRCAKLYFRRNSLFLCRRCHDLTYQSCIDGKSMTAFMAVTGAPLGLSVADVKREIAEDTRARNKWRRKRDRRPSYRGRSGRQREIPEKSLKRTILEAKVMSDMAKVIGRMGSSNR